MEFYVRLGIFGMISRFMLKCQEKSSECLKYGKTILRTGRAPDPAGRPTLLFFTTYFLPQVLCRLIQSTDIMIASIMFGSYLVTIADQMCLIFGCEL